ncbi:hypothetical protein [Anaerocolumna jejuensis]|nr:hypothetical protein [Anaerocolumna jejuensis]
MKIDKSTARNIIWILLSVISFIVVMLNLDKALMIALKAIHIFMPVILGLCLAFIINPLMNIFETKVFSRIGEKTKRKSIF